MTAVETETEAQKEKKQKIDKNTNPYQNNHNHNHKKSSTEAKPPQGQHKKAAAAVNNNNNKRKQKEVFPYGNYRSYYGYRIGADAAAEDARLKVLKEEWFEDKDCLDIGCNSGIMTIQIARKFLCRSILGLDIDPNRIEDARWHLRKFVRVDNDARAKATKSGVSERANGVEHKSAMSSEGTNDEPKESFSLNAGNLFDTVSFQHENFIQSRHPPEKLYDTILCLSVSKWVHLNWGDDGLITLFTKIWKLLRPGGILVLEPQPWKSYESNRRVSETTHMHYQSIVFRPKHFQEILLDKIGFRMVEDLTSGLSESKTGFDRPIFAFHK